MKKVKCRKCGGYVRMDYTWTDFFRALCPIQHLISDNKICFNCLEKQTAITVYYVLKNPIKGCEECEGTESCASSRTAFDAVRKNFGAKREYNIRDSIDDHTSLWGGAGPDCMPMQGGALQRGFPNS